MRLLRGFYNSWLGTIIIVLFVIFFIAQPFVIPSGSMKNTLLIGDFLFAKKFSYGLPIPHLPWLELPLLPDLNKNGHLITGPGPARGDIVVFRNPQNPKEHYVKRCVGVGGDKILFANSTLYVSMAEGEEFMRGQYPAADLLELSVGGQGRLYVREPFGQPGIHYQPGDESGAAMSLAAARGELAMRSVFVPELAGGGEGRGGESDFMSINGATNAYFFELGEDEYFMMGDNRDDSYDSRFWGAVGYELIVGRPWFVYFSIDEDKKLRWERIGRLVETLENDKKYIKEDTDEK